MALDKKARSLKRLLRPRSIAIFGGSWAYNAIEQCKLMGYEGEIWPVHPRLKEVLGYSCFASVDELPSGPDAAFVGVNRESTIEIVGALAGMGAGGAVCFASGFSEAAEEDASGSVLQAALLQASCDMPILGPNCYGFINYLDRALLWPDQHGGTSVESGVAVITQSSNIAINLTMQTRGLPMAYIVTAGNQAKVSLAQLAAAVLLDERVTALGLHIEGFGNIQEFEALARLARQLGKSIVALKVGTSEKARHALVSHTNSLTGSDAAADAFLSRIGVARVVSLSVLLETLKLLHLHAAGTGNQILSMSCSGGEACLMGDAVTRAGLEMPELNPSQEAALRAALGPRVALANPLDYHTYIWNDADAMQGMFAAMLQSNADLAVLVLDFPRPDRCEYPSWIVAIDAFKRAGNNWSGALAVLATLPENLPELEARALIQSGVVPFCGLDEAIAAMQASAIIHGASKSVSEPVYLQTNTVEPAHVEQRVMTDVSELSAKAWLRSRGVPVPKGCFVDSDLNYTLPLLADSTEDALAYPLVIKQLGLSHKSDVGGIRLGIDNADSLSQVLVEMRCEAGCLVEEQMPEATLELLVGIASDPVHGLLLSVGRGGVYTELEKDIAQGLLPLSAIQLQLLLRTLRCYPLIAGYRGKPGINSEQLIKVLMEIQAAALAIGDQLLELEINPLLCSGESIVAVDALLRVEGHWPA